MTWQVARLQYADRRNACRFLKRNTAFYRIYRSPLFYSNRHEQGAALKRYIQLWPYVGDLERPPMVRQLLQKEMNRRVVVKASISYEGVAKWKKNGILIKR
jgi:hypothetical protein